MLCLVSKAVAETISGGNETLQKLTKAFLLELPILLGDIRRGIKERDSDLLRRAAHTLKGSAGVFAAQRLVEIAQRLETMGEEGSLEDASQTLTELEGEADKLRAGLMSDGQIDS